MAMVASSACARLRQPPQEQRSNAVRVRVLRVRAAKKVETGRTILLSSTLVVESGKEDQATRLCKDIVDWAKQRKQELGRSSGIAEFVCNTDLHNENTYHFWERYDSVDYMTQTRACEEHVKFMNEVRPLLERPIGLAAYEYKDGQIGHVRVFLGPKGEGGLDDATNQGKQTSRLMTGGDTVDPERDYWGLKEAIAAKGKEKKDREKEFERTREALIARAHAMAEKAKEDEEPEVLTQEELDRRKTVADLVAKYDKEHYGDEDRTSSKQQQQQQQQPKDPSLLGNLKSFLGLKK